MTISKTIVFIGLILISAFLLFKVIEFGETSKIYWNRFESKAKDLDEKSNILKIKNKEIDGLKLVIKSSKPDVLNNSVHINH